MMRVAYARVPWARDLAEHAGHVEGFSLAAVDTQEEIEQAALTSDALVISSQHYSEALADRLGTADSPVRWIQFMTAGFDAADRWGVPQGIAVTNASAAWGPVVAEHAVALLLACRRRIPDMERLRLRECWDRPYLLSRLDALEGSRVGVLGYGAIGADIAKRLIAFDVDVVAFARSERRVAGLDGVHALSSLNDLLPALDAVVAALPLTEATRNLIDGPFLDRMKRSAVIVNVGRGQTVDEAALHQRLRDGRIAAAALDVAVTEPMPPGNPLWQLENVILSPHVAGFGSQVATLRLADLCRLNLERFRDGQPLLGAVEPVRRAATAAAPGSR